MLAHSTRTAVKVLLALTLLGALGASGLVWLLVGTGSFPFGEVPRWNENAVPERELPSTFGVRLPVKPLRYTSRSLGFQDTYLEVLAQLPPEHTETFLRTNHLRRGASGDAVALGVVEAIEHIQFLVATTPTLKAFELDLPRALGPDGGESGLHRRGVLLEAGGTSWVYLVASDD